MITPDRVTGVAWLGLGCNLGDRRLGLARLRGALVEGGMRIEAASTEMLTRAVGERRQPDFRNQVILAGHQPPLPPQAWLRLCRGAEAAAGRRLTWRWGPRRADVDLLLLGADGSVRVDGAELSVPHPALRDRPFLCALLAELAPDLRHPDGWAFAEGAGHLLRRAS